MKQIFSSDLNKHLISITPALIMKQIFSSNLINPIELYAFVNETNAISLLTKFIIQ